MLHFVFVYCVRVGFMVFNDTFNNTTFQLYHGGKFYSWRKPVNPEKTTDLSEDADKLYLHCIKVYI